MSSFDIDLPACRSRQKRLLAVMVRREIDLCVLTQTEHVHYLTGVRYPFTFQPAVALWSDGRLALCAPGRKPPEVMAVDDFVPYDAQLHSTLRNDQRAAACEQLGRYLEGKRNIERIGVEFSTFGPHLALAVEGELVDIEPDMYLLRRKKHADEMARIRKAIAATGKMYERARALVRPGVNELDVFSELQTVAVREFGEMMTGTGNDYACAAKGGPPRNRQAEAGELYILDLGPAFRGYFADNCRTLAVSGEPTSQQLQAWKALCEVLSFVEAEVRPGKSCRELFRQVNAMLKKSPVGKFDHHLGHGIGMFPHETPHLNPSELWDDHFEEGDVFTCEPGLYGPELNFGIRLENDYVVTRQGVENLSPFPLELA